MQRMAEDGNHSCYTFPGRKSRQDPVGSYTGSWQDPGSILAGLHNQERLTGSYIGS